MTKLPALDIIALTAMSDRAYRAMYAADQKFGHGSIAHRVAWTVFGEVRGIIEPERTGAAYLASSRIAAGLEPRVYTDQTERALALDCVERVCRGGRGAPKAMVILEEMAARKGSM